MIQPNSRGPLAFDAPNRFLTWAELNGPWKLMLMPVLDIHTGFPYSVVNEKRDFVGPRNDERFPRFDSFDLQVLRNFGLPFHGKEHTVKLGFGVFNLFNHANVSQINPVFGSNLSPIPEFGQPVAGTGARQIQFSLDFEF